MSRDRKLMAEIGRTMKKIDEGIDVFDNLYDKVYAAETQSQKLKFEGDLKKEIKKLQRLRDSIKTWASNNDIKDKTELNKYRKLIESKMEAFKICEKETKTKAYSKEGLAKARQLTPEEIVKKKTMDWVQSFIDQLNQQIEVTEADLESAVASGSGKKKKGKKKQTVKSEEEEELEEQLEQHQFHTSSLEKIIRLLDNDKLTAEEVDDIKEDVEYYVNENDDDDFMFDDETYEVLELDAKISALSGTSGKSSSRSSDSKNSNKTESSSPKKSSTKKIAALGSLAIGRGVSKKQAKENLQKIKAEEEKKQLAAQEKARRAEAQKALERKQKAAAQAQAQHVAQQKAAQLAAHQKAQQMAAQQKAAQLAASQQKQQHHQQQQQALSHKKQQQDAMTAQQHRGSNPPNNVIGGGNARQHAQQQAAQQAAMQQQQQQRRPTGDGAGDTKTHANGGLNQQHVNKSASIVPHAMTHHLLDAALSKLPMPSDSQRVGNLRHQARNPFNTPSVFPQEPSAVIHRQDLYAKLDVDTLFFIFYFQQGSYQQYLAAAQLKKQSWRYHKKYKTWFQRHEEPTETTEEYERGTYVYFDFESGWCQRIKTEFTFEYAFLEDDLKSIASSAPPAANGAAPPKGAATTGSTVTPS
jgi:CCR4-NOT transcription complex subunit 3